MSRSGLALLLAAVLAAPAAGQSVGPAPVPVASNAMPATGTVRPLAPWLDEIAAGLGQVEAAAAAGRVEDARQAALRLYLDQYELVESTYGPGSGRGGPELAQRIAAVELRFHQLLQAPDAARARALAAGLRTDVLALRAWAPAPASVPARAGRLAAAPTGAVPLGSVAAARARTPELRAVVARLDTAERAYLAGRPDEARTRVERLYLEGIEPLESRLPQGRVHEIEGLVHLGVRAGIGAGAPARLVVAEFDARRGRLLAADRLLSAGAPAWLGAANAFIILVREGLEAVLLLAALLAYLTATGTGGRERRQVYAGAAAGVVATIATYGVARLLIPIGGGSRELVEGITGLLAVAVLLYVSNWLFQKTYIHDWKDYLRAHAGRAVSTGSALAMAALAFAAVYREGFETVLFYQALLFDAGPASVLAGAIPGALLIGAIGVGIIRMGVKLPLRKVFAVTNAILLYLAFSFVGKGLYNLQEAGIFAPHPLRWVPDAMPLRQLFGIYPIAETLLAQLLFAAGVSLTYVYYRRRLTRPRAGAAGAGAPATPGSAGAAPPAATGEVAARARAGAALNISLPVPTSAQGAPGSRGPGLQPASRLDRTPDRL